MPDRTTTDVSPETAVAASAQQAAVAAQVLRPEPGAEPAGAPRPHAHGGEQRTSPRPQRVTSYDVADFPMPTGREEEWRFTPLDRLAGLLDGKPSEAHLDWSTSAPPGVEIAEISAQEAIATGAPAPVDRLSALAVQQAGDAVLISVPKGVELDEPVLVRLDGRLDGQGEADTVWGHVVLDIGALSRATVVVEHTGSARYASNVSVLVGEGAQLDLVSLQLWADDAVHAGHTGVRLDRDARLRSFQVTLGGDLVRIVETVEYDGPGGDAELNGLYFADAGQHLEHRLLVEHTAPHCRSRVTYKGALQGEDAHTIWIGDVVIRPAAEGTDTYEMNRNLVLTDGARADSVPNLEIETGEVVGAGHASTTGRFDDEQLFYLQSRGVPEEEARRLVVRGFFADLIQRIGVPQVQERLLTAVDEELQRAHPRGAGG
ncbi:MAG: Fe-S cluster assembly protein SufD [Acidothermales bacterium]|nr:Fe-S cluster assembly protein SufD [Acidothermales bacterium]